MFSKFAYVAGCCAIFAFTGSVIGADPSEERQQNWPTWRGPNFDGVAPKANPPIEWSDTSNIKWKKEIPGLGIATPIVWNDRVYILTAIDTGAGKKEDAKPADGATADVNSSKSETDEAESKKKSDEGDAESGDRPKRGRGGFKGKGGRGGPRGRGGFGGMRGEAPKTKHQFVVLCLDRQTGNEIWKRVAREAVPHEGYLAGNNSFASGSPTTDGKHLFVSFGSHGIYCYDLDGNKVWEKDLGDMQTRNGFGEGSSPTLHGDRLVVNWDHEGKSFIVALDAATGDEKWKVDRDEQTSWATPLVVEANGKTQVVTNAANRVRSYDLANGEMIWQCGGQTGNAIPSPLLFEDKTICMSGFRGSAIFSIPLASQGDLTDSEKIFWHHDGKTKYKAGTPYVPSALLYGDLLYFLKANDAILTCMSAKDGTVAYDRKRLEGVRMVYSSPAGAADRVYITGRDGTTAVLKHGPEFELLAKNSIDDGIDASPAIVGNEIFLRGKQHLYCIAAK